MTIFVFVVVLVVLIVVHEFGHFVVAKMSRMRVDEFGLGYPPRVLTIAKVGETLYTLNWIPFGGFVKIYGEDGNEGVPDPRAFNRRPRILQALVLLAGIAMNLVLAWIIFTVILMTPHWVNDHEFVGGLPIGTALVQGVQVTAHVTSAVATGLAQFFVSIFTFSADLSQVMGPIGIAGAVGTATALGWQNLLSLVALISINLALVNLLPIPALDGGRLLFVLIETITRRPIKTSVAQTVNATGFALLILLAVVVSLHDVYKQLFL